MDADERQSSLSFVGSGFLHEIFLEKILDSLARASYKLCQPAGRVQAGIVPVSFTVEK
jgi:hypothetical protein